MVQCGICGSGVHRDSGYFRKDGSLVHYSFYCSNKYIKTKGCSSKAVDEAELHNCIFQACKKQLELLVYNQEPMDDMLQRKKNGQVPVVLTKWVRDFSCFKDTEKLTKEMCTIMVKKVVLSRNCVSIHFTFTDEYEEALALKMPM